MAEGRRIGPGAALRVAEFRVLWAAECQSVVGDQLAKVALMWLVYARTGSASLAALSYALMLLPAVVGGPLLSGLADVYPRRTVMTVCALLLTGLVAAMALPAMPLPVLFGLIVGVQLAQAPLLAARTAVLPTIMPGDLHHQAQAVQQMTRQVGMVAGLALAGITVATIGVTSALLLDAATFAIAAVLIRLGLRHRRPTELEQPAGQGRLRQGLTAIRRDRRLCLLVALACLASFAVVPEGLVVPFTDEIGAGPSAAGWLLAADPAAMALVCYLLAKFATMPARQRLLGPLAVLSLAPLLGFALSPGFIGAFLLLALSGVGAAYQATALATFVELTSDDQRGQVYGLARTALIAGQGLGVAVGGVVAQATGSVASTIALAGATGLLFAVPAATNWARTLKQHPVLVERGVG